MDEQTERWNEFFNTSQNKCFNCGCDKFNILYLPTPCTPADIGSVAFRCIECNTRKHLDIIRFVSPMADEYNKNRGTDDGA